jgi:hypothetical protein
MGIYNGGYIMKLTNVIGTAFLLLLLGTTSRGNAEQQNERQDKNKEKHEQHQDQNKQKHAQQQDKDKQQQKHVQQQQHAQQQNQNKQQQQHVQQKQTVQQQQHVQHEDQNKQQHPQQQQQANHPSQPQQAVWQSYRAHSWQSEHRTWQQRGGYAGYRIPENHYHAYFGPNHGFRIHSLPMVVIGGYPRFQYGGYWFSLVDPWPEYWSNNWYENDDMYVDYYGDGYYLYNRRHPGNRIAISVYVN